MNAKLSAVTCGGCFNIFQFNLFKCYKSTSREFHCPSCETRISKHLVESKAIEWFNTMIAFLGVQDMECPVTRESRTDVLSLYSESGAQFKDKNYDFKSEFEYEVRAGLRDLVQLARDTGMKNLAWLVEQCVKL